MATTADKSGNSPIGNKTETHIKSKQEEIIENTEPA